MQTALAADKQKRAVAVGLVEGLTPSALQHSASTEPQTGSQSGHSGQGTPSGHSGQNQGFQVIPYPDLTKQARSLFSQETGATNQVTLSQARPVAAVLYAAYRDKAPVRVIKVDKDMRQVIEVGATFALYPAISAPGTGSTGAGGAVQPDLSKKITWAVNETGMSTGEFFAWLQPGTYFLATTKAGRGELLPNLWQFNVAGVNGGSAAGQPLVNTIDPSRPFVSDLQIRLTDYSDHSGLMKVLNPADGPQPRDPQGKHWTIEVADITTGILPNSGGERPWYLVWGLMSLASAVLAIEFFRATYRQERRK